LLGFIIHKNIRILTKNKVPGHHPQGPDFYGILASQMVGKFGRKVGRSGKKSWFLSHICRLGDKIYKRKDKITYLPCVFFLPFSLSMLNGLSILN
jgi:hypothetical protein